MIRHAFFLLALALIAHAPAARAQETLTPSFGGPGGAPFRLDCGPDRAIVGFNARVGDYIEAVQPVCQRVYANLASAPNYSPNGTGGGAGQAQQKLCKQGAVVTGLYGSWNGRPPGPMAMIAGNYVNGFAFYCSRWAPQQGAFIVESIYGFYGRINGAERMDVNTRVGLCPGNLVGGGLVGRSGALIDALAMVCRPANVPDTATMKNPPPPSDQGHLQPMVITCPQTIKTALDVPTGDVDWRISRSPALRLLSVSIHDQAIYCSYSARHDRGSPDEVWSIATAIPAGMRCQAIANSRRQVQCYRALDNQVRPPAPTDKQFIPR